MPIGNCPNCGHDWSAHSAWILRREKTCEEQRPKGDFTVKNTISEPLGHDKSVELDLDTGALTLLDSERGVELDAAEVLALEMFLCNHGKVILPFAFAQEEASA